MPTGAPAMGVVARSSVLAVAWLAQASAVCGSCQGFSVRSEPCHPAVKSFGEIKFTPSSEPTLNPKSQKLSDSGQVWLWDVFLPNLGHALSDSAPGPVIILHAS